MEYRLKAENILPIVVALATAKTLANHHLKSRIFQIADKTTLWEMPTASFENSAWNITVKRIRRCSPNPAVKYQVQYNASFPTTLPIHFFSR